MPSSDHDVIVIGCGTAGAQAASAAHAAGARTLAVESDVELGGLCILRGCMPTKTLLESARRLHDIRRAAEFGIDVADVRVSFGAVMERTRRLVERFQRAKVEALDAAGFELLRGRARFVDEHTVAVDGRALRAKAFVVASGSRPRALSIDVPRGASVLTSDDVFGLQELPASAVVVGAGPVGLELSQWLARLGSRVTLVTRGALLDRDPEMDAELTGALGRELEVLRDTELEAIDGNGDGVRVHLRSKDGSMRDLDAATCLNATGREPSFDGLALENLGLDPHDVGLQRDTLTSSVDHVFFAGDATGHEAVLHEAHREGALAGRNAARVALGRSEREPLAPLPELRVIFTDPTVAWVGTTPDEITTSRRLVRQARKAWNEQGRGIVHGARDGFVRLLANAHDGTLLGCQILGRHADELIHVPATMIRAGAKVDELVDGAWYHPTLSEVFLELGRELLGVHR